MDTCVYKSATDSSCKDLVKGKMISIFVIVLVLLVLVMIGLFWYLTVTFRRKWLKKHSALNVASNSRANQPLLVDSSERSQSIEVDIENKNSKYAEDDDSCCLSDFRVDVETDHNNKKGTGLV